MGKLRRIIPLSLRIFYLEHRYMLRELAKKHKKYLTMLLEENRGKSLSIDDEKKWIEKLNKLTYSYPELIEVGEAFVTSEISVLKEIEVSASDIITICVVKNDLIKLKRFISHHRKLGVNKFVILDNNSDDGSIDWLLEQKDVILLQTKIPYNTNRREGWINRIIAHYGDNRWYFVADSDELLVYNNCEQRTIQDVVEYLKKNNIVRARAVMIDMYANSSYYVDGNIEQYYNECVYFDTDTYCLKKKEYMELVCGGPRERVFGYAPWLTKYPLFYYKKKDVHCKSHFLYPHKENINTACHLVLKHYKFLPGEIEKYKIISKEENYYGKSRYYKKYLETMERNNRLDFFCNSTAKYEDSTSLDKINVYQKIDWK